MRYTITRGFIFRLCIALIAPSSSSAATNSASSGALAPPKISKDVLSDLLQGIVNSASILIGANTVWTVLFALVGWYFFQKLRGQNGEVPRNLVDRTKGLTVIVRIPRSFMVDAITLTAETTGSHSRPIKVFSRWHIDVDAELQWGPFSRFNLETARVAARLNRMHRLWGPISSRSAFLVGMVAYSFVSFIIFALGAQAATLNVQVINILTYISFAALLIPCILLWLFSVIWGAEQTDLKRLVTALEEWKKSTTENGATDSMFADFGER